MIIKSFEIDKIQKENDRQFLFYGDNIGLINEVLDQKFKLHFKNKIFQYEENEILKNEKNFFDQILTKSFFDSEKLIIVNRCTDKIHKIAEEIILNEIDDIIIIFIANNLDKRSKLRNIFEKSKNTICVAFYPDNSKTLSFLINNFFKNLKLSISQEVVNIMIERNNNDRQSLKNELSKIENFVKNKKIIKTDEILKLVNNTENNNISELVDCCLAKNQKKIVRIINENNFSNEDTILIIRTFLSKTKRLIKIKSYMKDNVNLENAMSKYKPPIFWKDKDLVKQQIKNWTDDNIEILLKTINENELLMKKNFDNSIKILLDFIFSTVKSA